MNNDKGYFGSLYFFIRVINVDTQLFRQESDK